MGCWAFYRTAFLGVSCATRAARNAMNPENPQDQFATFAALLQAAISEPGKIHEAYFAFHGYSISNQILALIQCAERGIAPGPIASFNKWKERERYVQKGQKAL